MPDILDFSPTHPRFLAIVGRGGDTDAAIGAKVAEIIAAIRQGGGEALLRFVNHYDAPVGDQDSLRVKSAEIQWAKSRVSPEFIAAVAHAVTNVQRFHEPQERKSYRQEYDDGVSLAKRILPISRVGVYCPAGTAPLFSSLIMNVVPARIAGVPEIAVAIPPQKDGSMNPHMLATAEYLGLTEIYRMGGAHAIAAFAHGAGPVRRVDKIVGPGNAYVATAKRQVFGTVGIDSVAGPSEIVVIADAEANPAFIAADILSQVEHGSGLESGVLLTDSRELAARVRDEIRRMLPSLDRADAIRKSLDSYGALFVCQNLDDAAAAANAIAPEHLEIQTAEPRRLLASIHNAGAVFLGPWASEPVGDYYAGTNHVLPTNGAARFSSSLGVADFQKDMSVIEYSSSRLEKTAGEIMLMAETEGLTAHANAIRVRREELDKRQSRRLIAAADHGTEMTHPDAGQ